VEYVQVVIQE